jgi:hypothetical protein
MLWLNERDRLQIQYKISVRAVKYRDASHCDYKHLLARIIAPLRCTIRVRATSNLSISEIHTKVLCATGART